MVIITKMIILLIIIVLLHIFYNNILVTLPCLSMTLFCKICDLQLRNLINHEAVPGMISIQQTCNNLNKN